MADRFVATVEPAVERHEVDGPAGGVELTETAGFLWRVEDGQVVGTGFAATQDQAETEAKAWVTERLASTPPEPVPASPIDLTEVLRFAGIEVPAEPEG